MTDKLISMGWHWTYGVLRTPEHDAVMETKPGKEELCYCYEAPDGDKIYTPYAWHKNRAHMVCKQDAKTGEKYISFSKIIPFEYIMNS